MKIKELISKLSALDQNLEVFAYSEDKALLAKEHGFRLLEINEVTMSEGELWRGDDQIPSIKFGVSSCSKKLVLIEVSSDA